MNRLQVRAGHCENVRRAVDQVCRERLAAQVADVYPFVFADLDGVKTGRLPANGMHPCRSDFNVFAIPNQPAKKSFRDRTTANIACANKENAFHGRVALANAQTR